MILMAFVMVAWLVDTPTLTMEWTRSDPPAIGYHVIAEYDGGGTECIAVTMDNKITMEWLKWEVPTRITVIPVGIHGLVHQAKKSIPSNWYLWGKLKLRINKTPLEVRLSWPDVGETVSILSSQDLQTWCENGEVPPDSTSWYDNTMNQKQKFYTIRTKE